MNSYKVVVSVLAVAGIAWATSAVLHDSQESVQIDDTAAPGTGQSPDVPDAPANTPEVQKEHTQLKKLESTFVQQVRETSIKFPNGETVDIKMKTWRPDLPPFQPTEKLIDMYDALVDAAEAGNAAAARTLYRELRNCDEAFTDEASYKKAIDTLHKEGVRTYPGGVRGKEHIHVGLDMDHHEEMITKAYTKCQGITEDHRTNKIQWAEMAAHGGDLHAMRIMANEHGFTPEGLEWYERAWLDGHVGATDALSIWYRNGAGGGGEADYFKSYAYLYLNYKVYEDAFLQSSSPMAQNRIVDMENTVRSLGAYLSPEQQAEAEALAAELLRANTNCCLGGWHAFSRY